MGSKDRGLKFSIGGGATDKGAKGGATVEVCGRIVVGDDTGGTSVGEKVWVSTRAYGVSAITREDEEASNKNEE